MDHVGRFMFGYDCYSSKLSAVVTRNVQGLKQFHVRICLPYTVQHEDETMKEQEIIEKLEDFCNEKSYKKGIYC